MCQNSISRGQESKKKKYSFKLKRLKGNLILQSALGCT